MENYFTERQKKILYILMENQMQTGKQLSQQLGVSIRTLQMDITQLNKKMLLVISSNHGYHINQENFSKIQMQMMSSQKQSHMILKKIILSSKPIHIQSLADELYISVSTLLRQIKSNSLLLLNFHLSIKRKDNRILIEGNEFNKRRFISYLINSEVKPLFQDNLYLNSYFPDIDMVQMRNLVLKAINHYNCLVDETYFSNLFLNIVIAFHRMKSGSYMKLSSDISISENDPDYKIAKDLCDYYAKLWRIEPSKEDISYIATILHGQIKASINGTKKDDILSKSFINKIDEILFETFSYYMLDINYKDQLYSFALHINALLKRSMYKQDVTNDLLKSVQVNSPFIYEVAILITEKIADSFHISISEQEIGYISIHIGFLIENTSKEKEKINVLLISSNYYHIEKNITERLNHQFGSRISIISKKDMNDNQIFSQNIDVLITTQPIQIIGKQSIIISPFFTLEDELKINNVIMQIIRDKEKELSYQLLLSYFHEELFIKTNNISTRDDAITFMGEKIIEFGLENPKFISSVKKREELSSTCFFDTFAIPHALEMNAKKTMFCVLINEKGIEWEPGKVIHIVIMLSVCKENRKEFMKIYNGIIRSLCDKEKAARIIRAKTFFEFLQQFKE